MICSTGEVSVSLKKFFFDDSKTTGARWYHFFFGFFKIGCCPINPTEHPFFCLIMTHTVMNHQINHYEVKNFHKKKLQWVDLLKRLVFLFRFGIGRLGTTIDTESLKTVRSIRLNFRTISNNLVRI